MASPPRRLSKRRTDAPQDTVADRTVVAKPVDPRQAALFDQPLPKWIKPCLPTLVEKPPANVLERARDEAPTRQAWCDAVFRLYGPEGKLMRGMLRSW